MARTKKLFNTKTKVIIFDGEMAKLIQDEADLNERDFTGQLRFIIKKYYEDKK